MTIQRSFLPEINYSARDFYTIVAQLQSYIKSGYSQFWNDFFESNEGQAFIDMVAYVGDQLNYYLDKRVNGFYFDTVSRRDSALRSCITLAYSPKGPTGATLEACSRYKEDLFEEYPGNLFDTGDTITVKGGYWEGQNYIPGTTVTVKDFAFEVEDDTIIYKMDQGIEGLIYELDAFQKPDLTNCYIIRFQLKQGTSRYDKFISNDAGFQQFESSISSVINDTWRLCIDGIKHTDGSPGGTNSGDGWIQARENSLAEHVVGSHVYTVDYFDNNRIRITFGDGELFGAIPTGNITIAYRVGGGRNTNITAGVLDPDEHKISAQHYDSSTGETNDVEVKLNNFEFFEVGDESEFLYGGAAKFGADEESLNQIKVQAPVHIKNTNRAITGDDIKSMSLSFTYKGERISKVQDLVPEEVIKYAKFVYSPEGGHIALIEQYEGGAFKIRYQDKEITLYLPSFALNVVKIYIWSLGTVGEPITPTTAIINALSDWLNRGDFLSGGYLRNRGMTSLKYLVISGGFKNIVVNLNAVLVPSSDPLTEVKGVWYDTIFNANNILSSIKTSIGNIVKDFDPGVAFPSMEVWRVVSGISGVLKFEVRIAIKEDLADKNDINDPAYTQSDIQVSVGAIARIQDITEDIVVNLKPKI